MNGDTYPLVLIEWWDSTGGNGDWHRLPTKEPEPVLCCTAGWLIIDGEAVKIVYPHWHGASKSLRLSASGCGEIHIPNCAIHRLVKLQEAGPWESAPSPS